MSTSVNTTHECDECKYECARDYCVCEGCIEDIKKRAYEEGFDAGFAKGESTVS